MKYFITSNLRIYQRTGKNIFYAGKIELEHIGNSAHTTEFLASGKALNTYINYLFYLSRKHVKWKHFNYRSLNNDFMMKRELNFRVTRNDFGYVLICSCVTLFLRVSYWGQVLKMNFCSINFDMLNILSFPSSWVICNEDILPLHIFSE